MEGLYGYTTARKVLLWPLTCSCPARAGINDFPNVGEEDIRKALPFLKKAGVPYYVHAELQQDDSSPVSFAQLTYFPALISAISAACQQGRQLTGSKYTAFDRVLRRLLALNGF